MKINNISHITALNQGQHKKKSNKTDSPSFQSLLSNNVDSVQIRSKQTSTTSSLQFQSVNQIAKNSSEDKINQITDLINSNSYNINSKQIADSILSSFY